MVLHLEVPATTTGADHAIHAIQTGPGLQREIAPDRIHATAGRRNPMPADVTPLVLPRR